MASKQLKIWRDDLRRYYNKTSLLMRVVIGAALSALFAHQVITRVVRPQNAENAKLKEKLETMEVIEDVESQVLDLQNNTRKIENRLAGLNKINAEKMKECGSLERGDIGQGVLELRSLIDKHELRISSETKQRGTGSQSSYSRRRRQTTIKQQPRVQITFPSNLAYETQQFSVLGSYMNLLKFLNDLHGTNRLIFVDNIKINTSKELLTDIRDLNQYRALSCSFEVHLPYLKEVGGTEPKDGKK